MSMFTRPGKGRSIRPSHRRAARLAVVALDERALPSVTLSNASLNENAWGGALVGTFSSVIAGGGGYTSYQLTAGAGDTNNGLFYTAGNQLRARQSLDHETQPTLSIHILATTGNGVNEESPFTITVNNVNERPKQLTLVGQAVPENSVGGTPIGAFSAVDPDTGDVLTYTLIGNAGNRFQISGNQLVVAPGADLNFEQQRQFYIRARATDLGGLSVYRGFYINVTDVNEAPTGLVLCNTVAENSRRERSSASSP